MLKANTYIAVFLSKEYKFVDECELNLMGKKERYTGCSKSKVLKIFVSSAQKYLEIKIFKTFILSVTL